MPGTLRLEIRLDRTSSSRSTFLVASGVCLCVARPGIFVRRVALHALSGFVLRHLLIVDLSADKGLDGSSRPACISILALGYVVA